VTWRFACWREPFQYVIVTLNQGAFYAEVFQWVGFKTGQQSW